MKEEKFLRDINSLGMFGVNIGLMVAIGIEFCRQYEMGLIEEEAPLITDPLGFLLILILFTTYYTVREHGGLSYYKDDELKKSEKMVVLVAYVLFFLIAAVFGYFVFNHAQTLFELISK